MRQGNLLSQISEYKPFYIVLSLDNNLLLKEEKNLKDTDLISFEIYSTNLEDAKKEFFQYKKDFKTT